MQAAIIELGITLETLKNNEPIHRAEGQIEQADATLQKISEIEEAIASLTAKPSVSAKTFAETEQETARELLVAIRGDSGRVLEYTTFMSGVKTRADLAGSNSSWA